MHVQSWHGQKKTLWRHSALQAQALAMTAWVRLMANLFDQQLVQMSTPSRLGADSTYIVRVTQDEAVVPQAIVSGHAWASTGMQPLCRRPDRESLSNLPQQDEDANPIEAWWSSMKQTIKEASADAPEP